jgi:hypothetical protein
VIQSAQWALVVIGTVALLGLPGILAVDAKAGAVAPTPRFVRCLGVAPVSMILGQVATTTMPAFDQGWGVRAPLNGVAEPMATVALPEHGMRVKAGTMTADPKHVGSTFDDFRGVDVTRVENGEDDLVTVSLAALLPEHPMRLVNEPQVLQAGVMFQLIHEVLCGVVTRVNRDVEEAYVEEPKLGHEVGPDAKGSRENVSVAHDFRWVRVATKNEDKVRRDHHLVRTPSPA